MTTNPHKNLIPIRPNNLRRAFFHNYRFTGTYMITIQKDNGCPNFSTLTGNPLDKTSSIQAALYPIGHIIQNEIDNLNNDDNFSILNYIIMPNHIHILWQVRSSLSKDLGFYIGLFKSRCSKICREKNLISSNTSVFASGYNDRIAFSDELINRFSNYITDNPRRRLIVMKFPQLFSCCQNLRIGNRILTAYGNFHLLKHPIISAVIVSRKYTDEQRKNYEAEWNETIRSGGVLISPFISQAERLIMQKGIEGGASIIRILPEGIPPKYKPQGLDFELCLSGRCLHIGSTRLSKRMEKLSRTEALSLNDLARWIASHPSDCMSIINASSQIHHS